VIAVAAMASLALEFGFPQPPLPSGFLIGVQILAVAVYVALRAHFIWTSSARWSAVRACWPDGLLLFVAAVFVAIETEWMRQPALKLTAVYVAAMQLLIALRLAIGLVRLNLELSQSRLQPTRVLALTFLVLIVTGALALALPNATAVHLQQQGDFSIWRHLVNCLFTATSATCVTGLVVYDTPTDFTFFGQLVILLLIQAGGLGIMIFGGMFGLLAGKQLSLKQSLVLQDALSHRTLGQLRRMIVFIVISTLFIEAVGAVVMYPMWVDVANTGDRVFLSVFHAVSAFCNAGFSLRSDSLIAYSRAWQVYAVIMPLIILGGLGFPVLSDLAALMFRSIRRLRAGRRHALTDNGAPPPRLSLHTKLVLVTTAVLIILPAGAFVLFESFGRLEPPPTMGRPADAGMMASASFFGKWLDAMFLSVTCRTAGFNTIPMDEASLTPVTHFLASALMFIGGSPASTAGGIKTVALAVLVLGVWSTLRGRERVEAFGRTIPESVVRRSAVVMILMGTLVTTVTLLLCFFEQSSLRAAWFEAVSACGTVGLSTGLTPELTVAGRIVIMVAMFAGRLGPLTLLAALAGRAPTSRYEYPSEQVIIG